MSMAGLRGLSRTTGLLLRHGIPAVGPATVTLPGGLATVTLQGGHATAALAAAGLASQRYISTSPAHGISNSTLDPSLARRTTPTNFGIRCCTARVATQRAAIMMHDVNLAYACSDCCTTASAALKRLQSVWGNFVNEMCHALMHTHAPRETGSCRSGRPSSSSALASTPGR